MSMEKLTIKEVKLKGITLPNKKKIIVDKYNEYVLLSTKNYGVLKDIRDHAEKLALELDQKKDVVNDFRIVQLYFYMRQTKRSKKYNELEKINKTSSKPFIAGLMNMFSMQILSNLKYKHPSEWIDKKYHGSSVRIQGLNVDSLSSEINSLAPERFIKSLYPICTSGTNSYKFVMDILNGSGAVTGLIKDCTKIYGMMVKDVMDLPNLLKQSADYIEIKYKDCIDKT